MALSTTHVATGSILGSGVGKPGAEVRWAVAGRMAVAWLITLPAAGLMGALAFWLSQGVESLTGSDLAGDGLIFLVLVALSFYMWWRAQQQKVDSRNVNADWDETTNSVVPADVREATAPTEDEKPSVEDVVEDVKKPADDAEQTKDDAAVWTAQA
jgi:PiT family inorganic phosphate transporter